MLHFYPLEGWPNSGLDLNIACHTEKENIFAGAYEFLLVRELKYFCFNKIDVEMNNVMHKLSRDKNGGVSRVNQSISSGQQEEALPVWFKQNSLNSVKLDIGLYEHVTCRLPLSSLNNGNGKRHAYFCSMSDNVAFIAVETRQQAIITTQARCLCRATRFTMSHLTNIWKAFPWIIRIKSLRILPHSRCTVRVSGG